MNVLKNNNTSLLNLQKKVGSDRIGLSADITRSNPIIFFGFRIGFLKIFRIGSDRTSDKSDKIGSDKNRIKFRNTSCCLFCE
jgi:hypothetical protein